MKSKQSKKIQKLLEFWENSQPLNERLQRSIDQAFMVDFNYNSNHIEGNTLTYGQTKLLLFFGQVEGSGPMRDFEEMKAHNVGLEMMKIEALDKRPLSEIFIRELNRTILAGDFYKLSSNKEYRYKIHAGVYKTRPNSVLTPSGEMFDYASPEETPSMMSDLVKWYNENEKKKTLSAIELAALFHYRYIRIHPFEDGNGRIARLLVNFILLRHGYPMIVIQTADRKNYIDALVKCDKITGAEPYNGANAAIKQIEPLLDYVANCVEKKLIFVEQIITGKIRKIEETDKKQQNVMINVRVNDDKSVSIKDNIVNSIKQKANITVLEIANLLAVKERTVYRNIEKLKSEGIIERVGANKNGYWRIICPKITLP
ncbi:MAG: Fic family protein [Fibromonadaceae bacterium]|jgi:Fic family protein|nr:Fic family protein [Fibromonadaceae bacterium]